MVTAWISSSLNPWRIAWAMVRMRSGVCWLIALITAALSAPASSHRPAATPGDLHLVETGEARFHRGQRLLQRFVDCAAIAIASPTDFIAVVR